MSKYFNPRLLNAVIAGTGMRNPVRPHVILGSEDGEFVRGDLMDANAIQEFINQKISDLVNNAPEALDTLKELADAIQENGIADLVTKGQLEAALANKVDKSDMSTMDANGHEYVEIGGIKWATMNIGANSVTDAGLYFAWGDTQGYTADQVGSGAGQKQFGWADYKYGNGAASNTIMTKYNATDGKTVLDIEDDAAAANWGGTWRMPTAEEFQILRQATTVQFVTDYQNSGVNGLLCIDKVDSSKTLFFPACGYGGYNAVSGGTIFGINQYAYFMSSSLYLQNPKRPIDMYIDSAYTMDDGNNVTWNYNSHSRCNGCSIRAILDTKDIYATKAEVEQLQSNIVQSDWNQSDNTAIDYIKNKPTIPDAQIQSDWNQTDDTAKDYIKNKPDLSAIGNQEQGHCKVGEILYSDGFISDVLTWGSEYRYAHGSPIGICILPSDWYREAHDGYNDYAADLDPLYKYATFLPLDINDDLTAQYSSTSSLSSDYRHVNDALGRKLSGLYMTLTRVDEGGALYSDIFPVFGNTYEHFSQFDGYGYLPSRFELVALGTKQWDEELNCDVSLFERVKQIYAQKLDDPSCHLGYMSKEQRLLEFSFVENAYYWSANDATTNGAKAYAVEATTNGSTHGLTLDNYCMSYDINTARKYIKFIAAPERPTSAEKAANNALILVGLQFEPLLKFAYCSSVNQLDTYLCAWNYVQYDISDGATVIVSLDNWFDGMDDSMKDVRTKAKMLVSFEQLSTDQSEPKIIFKRYSPNGQAGYMQGTEMFSLDSNPNDSWVLLSLDMPPFLSYNLQDATSINRTFVIDVEKIGGADRYSQFILSAKELTKRSNV